MIVITSLCSFSLLLLNGSYRFLLSFFNTLFFKIHFNFFYRINDNKHHVYYNYDIFKVFFIIFHLIFDNSNVKDDLYVYYAIYLIHLLWYYYFYKINHDHDIIYYNVVLSGIIYHELNNIAE